MAPRIVFPCNRADKNNDRQLNYNGRYLEEKVKQKEPINT